jgi:hypothetical protein
MENGMKWNYGEVGICGSCNGSGSSSGVCRLEVKTYSEQILEPSQVYEVHTILKAHIEIFYFILYLCILCIHSTLVESDY